MPINSAYTDQINIAKVRNAKKCISGVVKETPLELNSFLSEKYACDIYVKREDYQIVRSYKIRGAYNKIKGVIDDHKNPEIICASAGNHAQGVAHACALLGIKGKIYMPVTTPNQKISRVEQFGKGLIEIIVKGDNFNDCFDLAMEETIRNKGHFIHPFDDQQVISGQATIGLEIIEQLQGGPDFLFVPIGGGGLISGLITVFKVLSPKTKIIGVEPKGAPSMQHSLRAGQLKTLAKIDTFVDGAAVKSPGKIPFEICRAANQEITIVPEGEICSTILDLYNEEAIVVEPAGALSISALGSHRTEIKGKTVVCIISGGNNDIMRTEEIKERALLHKGLKQYFIIRFPQRAGALREFLNNVLGPNDDISYFQYIKKNNRSTGPAIVGLELKHREDFQELLNRMDILGVDYTPLNGQPTLFEVLI